MKARNSTSKTILLAALFFAINSCLVAQTNISGSFTSNGNTRAYLGAIPDDPEQALRLVILFCGPAESASQMAERHFNDYLGSNSMVIYPEPFYFMGAFGFEIGSEEDDFLMVEDLIDHIDSNYSIDTNDICIGGVSSGGTFTYDLVCEYNRTDSSRPYQFKAFAVVGGGMDSSHVNLNYCNIENEVPYLSIHGTSDPYLNYEGTSIYESGVDTFYYYNAPVEDVVDFWARTINGCDENPSVTLLPDLVEEPLLPSTVELIEYDCDNCSNTQLYKVIDGWGTWPTSNAVNDNLFGTSNQDVIGSQLIAEFFECSGTLSTSETTLDPNSVSLYPNPTADMLTIETSHGLERVEIFNITGEKVLSKVSPRSSIELEGFAPGIYLVKIETDVGTDLKKVVKQ